MTQREQKAIDSTSNGSTKQLYNSKVWRAKAHSILKRDRYECQECKKKGRYRRAVCVHHIIEVKINPELIFNDDNLRSLCKRCHNIIHEKYLNIGNKKERFTTPERW